MLTQFLGQIMFYCFIESAQVLCFMTGFWNTQNPALAVCFHVLVSILEFVHLLELETKVREFFTIKLSVGYDLCQSVTISCILTIMFNKKS